jgi:ribonuclease BN (tRNA processing enzyme)
VKPLLLLAALSIASAGAAAAQSCGTHGLEVQILGSGGPELAEHRAAASYLVWVQGKPRVLVDVGSGGALRFREAGASLADLNAIVFSNLRGDYAGDLPALIAATLSDARHTPLPVFGPGESRTTPSTVTFVRTLFDSTRGAYRYLGDILSPLARDTYKLEPHDVHERPGRLELPRKTPDKIFNVFDNGQLRLRATYVAAGQMPALAWRVESGGEAAVFIGDTRDEATNLTRLAAGADLLIADHSIAENAGADERALHMTPDALGRLAKAAGAKQLILAHRTRATFGHESESEDAIRKYYNGAVVFANDLECFAP